MACLPLNDPHSLSFQDSCRSGAVSEPRVCDDDFEIFDPRGLFSPAPSLPSSLSPSLPLSLPPVWLPSSRASLIPSSLAPPASPPDSCPGSPSSSRAVHRSRSPCSTNDPPIPSPPSLPRGRSTLRRFVFDPRPRPPHEYSPSPSPCLSSPSRTGPLPTQSASAALLNSHSHRPSPILTCPLACEPRESSLPTRLCTFKSPDDLSASVSSLAYSEMASSPAVDFLSAFAESTAPVSGINSNISEQQDPPGMIHEGNHVAGHILGPIIGRGGFSVVRQATNLETRCKVAVKIVRHGTPVNTCPTNQSSHGKGPFFLPASCHLPNPPHTFAFRDRSSSTPIPCDSYLVKSAHLPLPTSITESLAGPLLKREIEIWSSLKPHPHLVPLLSIHRAPYQTFIFMPLCDGGNLLQMLNAIKAFQPQHFPSHEHDSKHPSLSRFLFQFSRGSSPIPRTPPQPSGLELDVILDIFHQIALGLQYLHLEAGVTHKDIKLENLLIHEGRVMIADFGLAAYPSSTSQHHVNTRSLSTDPSLSRETSLRKHFNTLPRIKEAHNTGSMSLSLSRSVRERSRRRFEPGGAVPARFSSFSQTTSVRCRRLQRDDGQLSDESCSSDDDNVLPTAAGSLAYTAPEQLRSDIPLSDPSLDLWALGCVLYGLLEGYLPFQDDFEPRLRLKIMNGQFQLPHLLLPHDKADQGQGNPDAKDMELKKKVSALVNGCLTVDKDSRWTIEQVVKEFE